MQWVKCSYPTPLFFTPGLYCYPVRAYAGQGYAFGRVCVYIYVYINVYIYVYMCVSTKCGRSTLLGVRTIGARHQKIACGGGLGPTLS